ncbi:MAG: hypothetical protein IJV85_04335 [Clostridia bacterium]|nr:hypothetical protein [Clostridia bacterium]
MKTDFLFIKRSVPIVLRALSVLFVAFSFGYALVLHNAVSVDVSKNFYFLVSETTHLEAGSFLAQQMGGAGYFLEDSTGEYVALAVYTDLSDAQSVQDSLQGQEVTIVKKSVDTLRFKTREEKRRASVVVNALERLYAYIDLINQESFRLEKGGTQRSSKTFLEILCKQFSYTANEYEGEYPSFARVCKQAEEALAACRETTVFATDLRYLACSLSNSFVNLCKNFSL